MLTQKNIINEIQFPSNRSIVLAVVWIISKVLNTGGRGPTLIGQYASNKFAYDEQKELIEDILLRVSKVPTTRFLLEESKVYEEENRNTMLSFFQYLNDDEYFYRLNGNRNKAIWFLDNLESFQYLMDDILNERNHYYRNGFFCIVYTGQKTDRVKTLRTIFRRLFSIYVINVNVLMTLGETVYVYTYFPFSKFKCQNFEPYFHGMFGPITNFKYSRRKFFPKKLLNMWRCTVKVTTWTQAPFVQIEYNRTTGEVLNLAGIEGLLIGLLAERMNFKINIKEEPNNRSGDGTEPGAIKMLKDGVTNISLVCLFFDSKRQENAQPGYSYLHVPLNLAIPMGRMMTPLERLARPFKYIIWSCLSTSLLCGIIIIIWVKNLCNRKIQNFIFGRGNHFPVTNILNVLYGGQISGPMPRRNFARYLLSVWLIYTMIMRSVYLAQLYLILRDSRTRTELKTFDEALKQNFTFYSFPIAVSVLLSVTSKPINIKLLDTEHNSIKNLLKILGEDENAKIAITLLGHIIRAFNQDPNNKHRRINMLQEPILTAPLTLYMRKHSYLTYDIDVLILNIMSAGLISKFEELSLSSQTFEKRNVNATGPISLHMLMGLFFIHFVLLMLCFLVFLLELLSKYSPLTRKVIDLFNL